MDTVRRNKKQIQEYIKKQLEEDQLVDQMRIKEYIDHLRVASKQRHKIIQLKGCLSVLRPYMA